MTAKLLSSTRRFLFTFLILCVILDTSSSVKINRLQVPEVAEIGEPLLLDCDYTVEKSMTDGLVVKWFFNDNPTPIYQWILDKKPQELGIMRGRLNLDYKASEDRNSVHRALFIKYLGPELSGNYTCMVSTFTGEDIKTKRMTILVPGKSLELRQEYVGANMFQVVCYIEGVFPRPTMTLHIDQKEANNTVVEVCEKNGLYNIRATVRVSSVDAPEEFSCELHIPQANYSIKKEAIYYPVRNGENPVDPLSVIGIMLVSILHHTL